MFLNKSFQPLASNTKIKPEDYALAIAKAAQANTYIETICNKADSLHRRIEAAYLEDMLKAYKEIICSLVRRSRFTRAKFAIDTTDELFFGKTINLWIHNCKPENGAKAKLKYAVISMIDRNLRKKIPLLALPLHVGWIKAKIIRNLIEFAKSLCKVDLVLLDRGFFSGAVIRTLQELKVDYIVFVPKNRWVQQQWFELEESSKRITHTIKWCENKSKQEVDTDFVLVEEKYDWTFATNIKLSYPLSYVRIYKCRWGIETNFRVEDEAKIKSKSVDYLVRFFYFIIGLLLHALWLVFGRAVYVFKAFLMDLYEYLLFEVLGILHLKPPA